MSLGPGMTPDEYLSRRLDDQIAWFGARSQANQRSYKRLRVLEIFLAASIPFLAGNVVRIPRLDLVIGVAGVGVAVIAGLLSLYKYQENWIEYRTTCEALRRHKFRFLAGAEPYAGPEAFAQLVENVESLLAKESSGWAETLKTESPPEAPRP